MNWKKIKLECPKASELLRKWFGYKNDITVGIELSKIFMSERRLYDFFDKQGIYVEVMLQCNGWKPSLSKSCEEYYIKENRKLRYYHLRKEAEEAAFLKAFEILEKKLL